MLYRLTAFRSCLVPYTRSLSFQVGGSIGSHADWCAGHDQHDRGRSTVARLNGGIEGYDVDFHYSLIRRTVELERKRAREILGEKKPFWKDVWDTREIFFGVNGFRTLIAFMPAAVQQVSSVCLEEC